MVLRLSDERGYPVLRKALNVRHSPEDGEENTPAGRESVLTEEQDGVSNGKGGAEIDGKEEPVSPVSPVSIRVERNGSVPDATAHEEEERGRPRSKEDSKLQLRQTPPDKVVEEMQNVVQVLEKKEAMGKREVSRGRKTSLLSSLFGAGQGELASRSVSMPPIGEA